MYKKAKGSILYFDFPVAQGHSHTAKRCVSKQTEVQSKLTFDAGLVGHQMDTIPDVVYDDQDHSQF